MAIEMPHVVADRDERFEAVTEELILLSTRNANLEQELDEMKKKYDLLQESMNALNNAADRPEVEPPIGFICDELELDRKTLGQHIAVDQLEQLYLTIDGKVAFTETQQTFLKLVSEEISDELFGLLNVLAEPSRDQIAMFHRCVIMEMVIYINAEWEVDGDEADPNAYDLKTIYSIAVDKMGVSRRIVNDINSCTQERLHSDTKIETLIATGDLEESVSGGISRDGSRRSLSKESVVSVSRDSVDIH